MKSANAVMEREEGNMFDRKIIQSGQVQRITMAVRASRPLSWDFGPTACPAAVLPA